MAEEQQTSEMREAQEKLQQTGRRVLARLRGHPILSVAAIGAGGLFLAEAIGAAEVAVAAALAYGAFRMIRPRAPSEAT